MTPDNGAYVKHGDRKMLAHLLVDAHAYLYMLGRKDTPSAWMRVATQSFVDAGENPYLIAGPWDPEYAEKAWTELLAECEGADERDKQVFRR